MQRFSQLLSASTTTSTALVVIPSSSTGDIDLDLQLQVAASAHRTYETAVSSRPKNTFKAYSRCQQEFIAWCAAKGFDPMTQATVTSDKLHWFLQEKVLRRCRRRSRRSNVEDESVEVPSEFSCDNEDRSQTNSCDGMSHSQSLATDSEQDAENRSSSFLNVNRVGHSTVMQYVAAMVDLWVQQKQKGVNANPNPRVGSVGVLLTTLRKNAEKARKLAYIDRGAGTHLEGYSNDDLKRLSNFWLAKNTEVGLRDRLAFLLCHYGLMRGDNVRELELCDIHSLDLGRKEGYSERCMAVVCILRQGKTNQYGRVEFGSFMRNSIAEICPIGGLALYLFARFHMSKEPFPVFRQKRDWYDLKLLRNPKSPTVGLNYSTQLNAVKSAFSACGIISISKTHASRRAGAQMAESSGAGDDAVRRAGRWNQQSMEGAYLSAIPRKVLRGMAGFNAQGGSYFLAREVPVPIELQKLVFPEAEAWLAAIRRGETEDGHQVPPDMAGVAFLELLIWLREVFWQDIMALRSQQPSYYIFQNEIFSSEHFTRWAAQYESVTASIQDPMNRQLELAMPLLYEKLTHGNEALLGRLNELEAHTNNKLNKFERSSNSNCRLLFQMMSRVLDMNMRDNQEISQVPVVQGNFQAAPNSSTLDDPASVLSRPGVIHDETGSSFTMSREVGTCRDLWREWYVGLSGKPSVTKMDEEYGTGWRRTEKDRKFYTRRSKLITAMKNLSEGHGISLEDASMVLDHQRQELRNKSMAHLVEVVQRGELPVIGDVTELLLGITRRSAQSHLAELEVEADA